MHLSPPEDFLIYIMMLSMALCFRIHTGDLFSVIVDCLSTPHRQNQMICPVVEETPTLNKGILIPVSWYYFRWIMLERRAAPSRHQLLLYRREQHLTWGQRIVWSPTATEQSAFTVRDIIKATGEWWLQLMSLWCKKQDTEERVSVLHLNTHI